MRRLLFFPLALVWGCQVCADTAPRAPATSLAVVRAALGVPHREAVSLPMPAGLSDLGVLWELALANNPVLREAAADVEAARGQWIQAGKYPNPRFAYRETVVGTTQDPAGDLSLEATQEIITGGKRRLDVAIARRGTDVAAAALRGRTFQVLTRVRRAYYDAVGWAYTVQAAEQTLAALDEAVEITRRQVEEAKIRPRTDLIRLTAVREEARLTRDRARISLEAAWRQLAAEVGVPDLPLRGIPPLREEQIAQLEQHAVVRRVLAVHSDLAQAALEAERARLEVERARAEAVPNLTVGGGYSANYPERQHGGTIGVEAPLPLWDRKEGRIHQAQARLAKARAAEQTTALRLVQETTEALGRYRAARERVERLTHAILPSLMESLALVRRGYQTGAAGITFADVLLAEQTLGETRLRLAEAWRDLGRAVADLEGLMQLAVGDEGCVPAAATALDPPFPLPLT